MRSPKIAVVGSLDTKFDETVLLAEAVRDQGGDPLVIDTSAAGRTVPGVGSVRVHSLGLDQHELARLDRGDAVRLVTAAAADQVAGLVREGALDGVVSAGGSNAAMVFAAIARVVPFGSPKVIATTMATVDAGAVVGDSDVTMIYPVADIDGLNSLTTVILRQAAAAVVGMARVEGARVHTAGRVVAASMFGVTTACVQTARKLLEASGDEVIVFHATGTGGRSMESLADAGRFKVILDVTTTELADLVAGGNLSAGEDRLDPSRGPGIPRVIAPGAVDMANFGPRDSIPAHLEGRRFYLHNDLVTLMRTTPRENRAIGERIGRYVAARDDSVVVVPLRGVSALDRVDGPFWDPEALDALVSAIRDVAPVDRIIEVDAHINDDAFATVLVEQAQRLGYDPA